MGRLDRSPRANWVEKRGGLPDYIDRIANHLHEGGMPISQAIATGINATKRMCSTGDLNWPGLQHVNPGSRAEACAAVSQWEAMKTSHAGGPGLALAGSWDAMLHPRVPAGSAGGGKFATKGGGGGGAAKKAAGKGAKGAKSASAQAAAQAKIIAPQFMAMNPQARAQFLAKLTDPQLKALLHEVSQGNSNDPATRAALVAIKDQIAARSLTGAKGPTQINQAKAASAAKTAANQQAAAQKKAATAQTAAAKKATKPAAKAPAKPAVPAPPVKASHSLSLAVSATTSGDGPAVTINAAQRRVYAKSGVAMADGSYPIPDKAHLRKAILSIGHTDPAKRAAVKAHIRKRAAALGVQPPAGAKKGT